ncbi:kinesin-like protein KIF15-A isoform X3 [Corythoichthys intestinalis]|uniref:kinesin-like protein KIF15-A isoform X3 n=1 Tax=Corythoichthys intestinalis TaxID=161448 RepID=UPI0025A61151|nr:kinesin-like protein KIF15-A isoform X3 [Corythoichthys intestinalis]
MVKSCVAVGCKNREDRRRDLNFYRIPRDPKRRPRLTAAIRRENWAPNDYHRLCSSHFISAKGCVFIHEDGQSLDYLSKDEQLQHLIFDHAVTIDNMQGFYGDLLQPLTVCACEGYCGSLLICAASMENIGTLIDEVIIKQMLASMFSHMTSRVEEEWLISVSYLQFHPDGLAEDLLNHDSQTLQPFLHPVLGVVIRGLGEACDVGSADEAYTLYKACREAQKGKEELRSSWLFTVAVEWKLQEGDVPFTLKRGRLQVFGLVGGAGGTDLTRVNPLLKVMNQSPSEATKTDPLLHFLLRDALTGNQRTRLIYFIKPQGDLDDETPSALALAQKVKHLTTKASVCCWCPEETQREIRSRIAELRHVMMSDVASGTYNIHRLAELIQSLQIVKEQSWKKKREESQRIKFKVQQLCGPQKCQMDSCLSGGEHIHHKESLDTAKNLEEELRREMEMHVKEDRRCMEKVQESITRILQLKDALKEGLMKNITAEKCDLCLQLNDEYLFEDSRAHERGKQLKELSGSLIQREVEKMERDLAGEQLSSAERELLVLSRERQILLLQMETLRAEAQQARKHLQEQHHKHQTELRRWREDSRQVFRRFHESSEDQKRISEARYKSILLEAVHDAVQLSAQNQRLQADNKQLRRALGELKDTLTKRGEPKAPASILKND